MRSVFINIVLSPRNDHDPCDEVLALHLCCADQFHPRFLTGFHDHLRHPQYIPALYRLPKHFRGHFARTHVGGLTSLWGTVAMILRARASSSPASFVRPILRSRLA